jgi:hypothetical protein
MGVAPREQDGYRAAESGSRARRRQKTFRARVRPEDSLSPPALHRRAALGTDVAVLNVARVRVLQARFHPATKSGRTIVVVGLVICDGSRARIERIDVSPAAVKPFDSTRLHKKLEFIVMTVVGDSARGLLQLASGYWSFVETSDAGR